MAIVLTSAPAPSVAMGSLGDPLEPANRVVFALNELFRPTFRTVAEAVDDTVGAGFAQALRNLSNNLAEPGAALGHLAEGDLTEARLALKRFLVNSVEGPLGLRDIAAVEGLPARPARLQDVLCRFGVPSGPYLVLPFFGGMSLRGAAAQAATISAAFVILGEYYVGYRVMTYLLAEPTRSPSFQEMQFLVNGYPDPYAAVRARRQAIEQASCTGLAERESGLPHSSATATAVPSIAAWQAPVFIYEPERH